jgi:hypothetical protein
MSDSLLRRALLATALGLGITAGLARAQPPLAMPAPPAPAPQTGSGIAPPAVPTPSATQPVQPTQAFPLETSSGAAPCVDGTATPEKKKLLSCLRPRTVIQAVQSHRPFGCYSSLYDYSCTNLHTELLFIFGSCRQFYGERCLKERPISPVPGFDDHALTYTPPGAGPPRIVPQPRGGSGARSGAGSGCGCGR